MIGVHRVRVVLHGVRLSAVVVERAEKAVVLADLIVAEGVGRDTLGIAELHIGVVRAQRRPVVVGAEVDILRPVGHQRVVQGYRLYILPHSRQNILLRLCLVAAGDVTVQAVRQGDAAGQGDSHGVHIADAAETVRHTVDHALVLLRQRAYIVVHLVPGAAHDVYAAGLIGLVAGGDDTGAGRLGGGHRGLAALRAGLAVVLVGVNVVLIASTFVFVAVHTGLRGIFIARLGDGRVVRRGVRGLFSVEYIGKNGQDRYHQRRRRDQQQNGSATAVTPFFVSWAHPTYSLITALAVSVSAVTHSTTQVP